MPTPSSADTRRTVYPTRVTKPVLDPWERYRPYHDGAWIICPATLPKMCNLCHHEVVKGDVAYVICGFAWTAFHLECAQTIMKDAPKNTYDTIRERLASGGPLFDE